MRVAVPVFGAGLVAETRALFGAMVLVPAALLLGQRIDPLAHWRDYLHISVANNVLPFACFAFAATALPASYLAILNGLVPLCTALFASWLLGERLGAARWLGFVFGVIGVALLVKLGPVPLDARILAAVLVGVLGAGAWAWGGVVIKQRTGMVPAIGLAAGTTGWAAVLMSPLWTWAPSSATWTLPATSALIALGTLCSGVSYLLFFTLVRDIGPSRTLTTGFLVPALGVLWGWLLLGEAVTGPMLVGAALVLIAMALVLRR
jgi:drug/metabolite transporter (DMT)-like permease